MPSITTNFGYRSAQVLHRRALINVPHKRTEKHLYLSGHEPMQPTEVSTTQL